jgi:hypothetical protein
MVAASRSPAPRLRFDDQPPFRWVVRSSRQESKAPYIPVVKAAAQAHLRLSARARNAAKNETEEATFWILFRFRQMCSM